MMKRVLLAIAVAIMANSVAIGAEPGVRYYEENGVQYRETRRIERIPISETKWVPREEPLTNPYPQTGAYPPTSYGQYPNGYGYGYGYNPSYRQPASVAPPYRPTPYATNYATNYAGSYPGNYPTNYSATGQAVTYVPVTDYRWEPRVHGRWNPFQQPHVAYHWVPATRWEPRYVGANGQLIPPTQTGNAATNAAPLPNNAAGLAKPIATVESGNENPDEIKVAPTRSPNSATTSNSGSVASTTPDSIGRPGTRIVHVPQRTLRFEEREVVERVAVNSLPGGVRSELPTARMANRESEWRPLDYSSRGMPISGAPFSGVR